MNNLTWFAIVGMMSLSFPQSPAQQQPTTVQMTVIHNGHLKPAPSELTVSFGAHSWRIPVREGKFEVPPAVLAAERLTLETDAENSHIRFIHMHGADFAREQWTLRLAEHANVDYYNWPGPKGANIPSTCMLVFDSLRVDPAIVLFEENCRSKKK